MTRTQGPNARSCLLAALACAGALLALPAAGHAATPFGSPLTETPSGSGSANVTQCQSPPLLAPCTRVLTALNGSSDQPITAPMAGVVTKFRIKSASADTVTFRIARLSDMTGTSALGRSAGTGPTATLKGDTSIEEYAARVPVQQGDYVALDASETSAQFGSNGSTKQYQFVPPLADGQGPRGSNGSDDEELLVQAVIEADADGDGFGDETQDGCPGNGQAAGACPVPDTTAPIVSRLKLRPSLFVKRSRISYNLSENASVTFRVKRCVRPIGKRCALYRQLRGKLIDDGEAGANTLRLTRKLRGKRLSPARYVLTARAVDPAGNRSLKQTKKFRIVL